MTYNPKPAFEQLKVLGLSVRPSVSENELANQLFSEAKVLLSTEDKKKVVEIYLPQSGFGYEGRYHVGYVTSISSRIVASPFSSEMNMVYHTSREKTRDMADPISIDEYKAVWENPQGLTSISIMDPLIAPKSSPYKPSNRMRYAILFEEASREFKKPS
jgi:hypothetical protein